MKQIFILLSALTWMLWQASAQPAPTIIDGANYSERSTAFLRYCAAARPGKETFPKEAMAFYVARLLLGQDTEYALKKIDEATEISLKNATARLRANPADDNARDPFIKHSLMHGYLIARDKIPAATAQKIRDYVALYFHKEWRGFGSMNYRLMKDASGFVAAETWPDLKDSEGLDAEGIKAATRARLYQYFHAITHENLDEYNGPIYYATDLMPIRMLADFAQDGEMRRRATLTLDWMMINLANAWNQGYYVSAAARSKYWGSLITSPDSPGPTAAIGWFYFGGRRGIDAARTAPYHAFWMAYPSRYQLPEIIARVASQRERPFAARESVLSFKPNEVRKYTWHTPSYTLASQWENVPRHDSSFYKETKRQMLKWLSDKPVSTFSVQQENYLRPYRPKDVTKNAFGYGENPFHQVLQHEGTLVGVYAVPANFPFYKLYVPFTKSGAIVRREEKEGWVFCHGGSMLFAFKLIKSGVWGKPQENCDVLWSEERNNGWVLETSEVGAFAGGGTDAELNRFANTVLQKTKIEAAIDGPLPRLKFTSLNGHVLEITYRPHGAAYKNQHQINGAAVEYRAFALMENPWLHQAVNSSELRLNHGGQTRLYDFQKWMVAESKTPRASAVN
jgi:hypothetical protein